MKFVVRPYQFKSTSEVCSYEVCDNIRSIRQVRDWAILAIVDTSVSISTSRLSAAYNTVPLLALAQEMEVPI